MNTFARIGTALAIAALATTDASAETFKKYGFEAGWEVLVNEKTGGCLIAQGIAADTQVQMGIDPTAQQQGFLALYTKTGAEVGAGERISVSFDVDGEKFSGEATGAKMEGFDGAYVRFNNPEFIYDLAMKKTLTITPEGRDPIVLSLAGTEAAFKALRACQEAQ